MKPRPQDEAIMEGLLQYLESKNSATEVPVAAALYDKDLTLLSMSTNKRESTADPSAHAEVCVLREIGQKRGNWNLEGLTLFVTLEPCLMCAGAILESKISRLVFGAFDIEKSFNLSGNEIIRESGQKIEVIGGVLEKKCQLVMRNWFEHHRQKKGNI